MIWNGIGLFSGKKVSLRLDVVEHSEVQQILYLRDVPVFNYQDVRTIQLVHHRNTGLENLSNHKCLQTVEHFSLAMLPFSQYSLNVYCDEEEYPAMDGSAWPFYSQISSQLKPHGIKEYSSALSWDWEGKNHLGEKVEVHLEPNPCFEVEYTVSYQGYVQSTKFSPGADNIEAILKARTFIWRAEWEQLQATGALSHVTEEMGLLVDVQDQKLALCSGHKWRSENELAEHKIADLMGDLSLNGLELPKLKVKIVNGGHWLHHKILRKIIAERK